MVAKNNSNEIRLIRTYDAPVKVVWDAWNDPEQAAKWWGPRGFTITNHGKDLRPGGYWSYTMHGPDGTDYVNKTIYYEVEECKKLVYDHGGSDDRPPLFRVTVLFSEHDGRTTMDFTMRLPTAEEAEQTRKFIKAAGGNATWDRLAEYLDETLRDKCTFVVHRSFAARPDHLFELWHQPDQLAKWLPPPGFNMKFSRTNMQLEGDSFFEMSNGQMTIFGVLNYVEIVLPTRLVYIQKFCDAAGQPARHPALSLFPESLLMTVSFTVEDELSTRVTLQCEPCSPVTAEEIEVFKQTRRDMTNGWNHSFDKLDELI